MLCLKTVHFDSKIFLSSSEVFIMCELDASNNTERSNQGLVKGAELCLNPYFFGWLASEVLSPC